MAFIFTGPPCYHKEPFHRATVSSQNDSLEHSSAYPAIFPYFPEGSNPPMTPKALSELVLLSADLFSSRPVAPCLATVAFILCVEDTRHIPSLVLL